MASSLYIIDESPGFLMLPLSLFKDIRQDHLECRIASCQRKLNFEGLQMQTAVQNLLGVLYYKTGKMRDALCCFEKVLETDKNNFNALEHTAMMYEKSCRSKDSQRNRQNITLLETSEEGNNYQARCLAEKGYAIAFEAYDDIKNTNRYKHAIAYFEKALSKSDHLMPNDIAKWNICIAIVYHKMWGACHNDPKHDKKDIKDISEKCARHLLTAIRFVEQYPTLHAMALMYLGIIFSKSKANLEEFAAKNNCQKYYENPENCFSKAASLDPENAEIKCRHAKFLHFSNQSKKALNLLNKNMNHRVANWFFYATRADILVRLYKYKLKIWRKYGNMFVNKKLLIDAKHDCNYVLELNGNARDFVALGEIHHLLGVHDSVFNRNRMIDEKETNEALGHFLSAVTYLDGDKMPLVHLKRGKCLYDVNEKRQAAESYKREVQNYNNTEAFELLLNTLIELYEEEGKRADLLGEIAFWIETSFQYQIVGMNSVLSNICKFKPSFMHHVIEDAIIQENSNFISIIKKAMTNENNHALVSKISKFEYERENKDRENAQIPKENGAKENVESPGHACQCTETVTTVKPFAEEPEKACEMSLGAERPLQQITNFQSIDILPNARNKLGKPYDFFVIYSNKNKNWVFYSLRHTLESHLKFKGCIAERDFQVGTSIITNIENAIRDSVCTIAILTEDFNKSNWCQTETDWALVKHLDGREKHYIIPIKLEECEIPFSLRTITHLDAVEYFQVERLARNLKRCCEIDP